MTWFTKDLDLYFKDLAKNNNKEWFNAHKKRYETSVKKPFHAFVEALIEEVGKHDRSVQIEAKEAIFRINRDIRFSKDKTPYKLSVSAIVSAGGRRDHSAPGIYVELGPENIKVFGGSYAPEKEQLHAIRKAIQADHKTFKKIVEAKEFKQLFGSVQGEANKILPAEFKDFVAKEPLIANKQFYVGAELPASRIASPKLMDLVMERYLAMKPFNAWLSKVLH